MAVVNAGNPTLLDQVKRMDPDGSIANIVEMLEQKNPILQDATFLEGNLPTGHRFVSRTGLPSVSWRRFNEGVTAGKSRTDQIDESCGMLVGRSVVDVQLAKLNGNEAAFRASEDKAFLSSLNNEVATGVFYHSTKTAPEKFHGLAPRFDSTTAVGGSQIILHDPAGNPAGADQSSIWFVTWGPDTCFMIYPKGSMAGIESADLGEQLVDDGSGKTFRAYVTEWTWKLGLCVKDWRYVARVANLDKSALSGTGDTIIPAMIQAYSQLQDHNSGRMAIYVNRTVHTYLWLQGRNAAKNSTLSVDAVEGKPVLSFMGIPIRVCDALATSESVIS